MAASTVSKRINVLLLNLYLCLNFCLGQLELNDAILEKRGDGMWLIEFYAPWCGHCKKLEPVYQQVHVALRNTGINVGKIDSTRYSSVATELNVRGFPTIKFLSGKKDYTYRGDRSKEDIIEFAIKAKGPAVRKITSEGRFLEARERHAGTVFFMFIGDEDSPDDLFKKYSSLAEENIIKSYFYYGSKNVLPHEHVKTLKTPTILVFKDKTYYEFIESSPGVILKDELEKWFNIERFAAFPRIIGSGLNDMSESGKYLVLTVVSEDKDKKEMCSSVMDVVSQIAKKKRLKYHGIFQFLWMPDEETANSITMSFLDIPAIVVLDTVSHHFYFLEKNMTKLTVSSVEEFLAEILSGKQEAYGGTGIFQKLKRVVFDFLTTALSIWQASRWLFLLMFGLPTVIISIVCYSLCCMESIDDATNSDDEDYDGEMDSQYGNEENHEKVE